MKLNMHNIRAEIFFSIMVMMLLSLATMGMVHYFSESIRAMRRLSKKA